ncbi:MAG TPA: outer membrane protein assembly factor BamC [Burkholderiaceae bacterium]|nr:outer membrane protein assembly factor BamC [Burkholderiaceae bacterium]
MAQRSIVQHGLIGAFALSSLAACTTFSTALEPDRIDYKSANQAPSAPKLEVPPDLTQLQKDNRYQVPEITSGTVSASTYDKNKVGGATTTASGGTTVAATVAVNAVSGMHIERDGSQHWLVVHQTPEALWPQLRDFWQESGFLINVDRPADGIMETDWAENRAKIPSDFIRETLGKVLDSLWSTGQRDKFRTRLERAADGSTEIYISHQGVEEVLTGSQKETTAWQPRPAEPGLEVEFLGRVMARLANDPKLIKTAVANAVVDQPHAKLVSAADASYVEVDEGFDHAWRRVGLALDRVGFTVEDRDRTQGLYFVRYVDEAKSASEKGFFSKLLSFGSDDAAKALKYRVSIVEVGDVSKIVVLNNDGKPENSDTTKKILNLLNEQLK